MWGGVLPRRSLYNEQQVRQECTLLRVISQISTFLQIWNFAELDIRLHAEFLWVIAWNETLKFSQAQLLLQL